VVDSCVKDLGARAQNTQFVGDPSPCFVGDPSSCAVQCLKCMCSSMASKIHGLVLALHGCRRFVDTLPRTRWAACARSVCTPFILFSPVCCRDALQCCARTYACTQFSNVRVDIHDRGAGEGCQLTLVQDSIPSNCVDAADRYQRLCYRFPPSLSFCASPSPPHSLALSLSRSLALSLSLHTCMSSDRV